MKGRVLLAGIVLAPLLFVGCHDGQHLIKNKDKRHMVEEKYRLRVENLLHERQEELLSMIDAAGIAEQEALKFLYAYSTLSDLSNYDGTYFLGQVQYALKARETFSWGRLVSEDDFLHFVLPPRVGTENLDTARQVIFRELLPRISDMGMKEAALEINHWCHEKVIYTGTDGRTSAPLATIRTAFGRCGEESVLAVTALRAAGIPARQIYTPRWVHQDDNHAWVEFWADGEWYYFGACEPGPDVNMAWFTEPARRSILTSTTAPGHYDSPYIIRREDNYTILNQTGMYTDAKDLTVRVVDGEGRPMEGASVRYLVYNYAEFYPLAVLSTDADGYSSMRLGRGDVMVWVSDGNRFDFLHVPVAEHDTVVLVPGNKTQDEYRLEMDMLPPPIKPPLPLVVSAVDRARNNLLLAREDSIRHAYESTFPDHNRALTYASDYNQDGERFASFLLRSRGNWQNILALAREAGANPNLLSLLDLLSEKDLRDAPSEVLLSHLLNTPEPAGEIPRDIWLKYVLNPRIALERLTPYREELRRKLGNDLFDAIAGDAGVAEKWVEENIRLVGGDENYVAVASVPAGTVSMRAADSHSRDILFVALCRTAGVPARINQVTGMVEYLYNGKWERAFAGPQPESVSSPARISFSYDGTDPCRYSVNFSLACFENGFFRTLAYDHGRDVKSFPAVMTVEPGYYMLVTGNRRNDGSVMSSVSFFILAPGRSYKLPVSPRKDERAPAVLAGLVLPGFIDTGDGSKVELGQLIKTFGAATLIWLEPGREPTSHVLKDMRDMKGEFDELGMPFLFFVPEEKKTVAFDFDELVVPANSLYAVDTDMLLQLTKAFGTDAAMDFPVIAMVNVHGDVLYYSSGYSIGTGDRLLKRYRQVRRLDGESIVR